MQTCLDDARSFLCLVQLALQVDQAGFIRRSQCAFIDLKFFATRIQLAALFLNAALVSRQHLNLLLHLGHLGALLVRTLLR